MYAISLIISHIKLNSILYNEEIYKYLSSDLKHEIRLILYIPKPICTFRHFRYDALNTFIYVHMVIQISFQLGSDIGIDVRYSPNGKSIEWLDVRCNHESLPFSPRQSHRHQCHDGGNGHGKC